MTGATKIISIEIDDLKSGVNIINLIEGTIVNDKQKINKTFKDYGAKAGKELYMSKVRAISIFADADLKMAFQGAEVEFDMMSFYKKIKPIEIEEITLQVDNVFVPDSNRVIIVASDRPDFDFDVLEDKPHLFYSNRINGVDNLAYQTIIYKHTNFGKFKATIFNNLAGAKDILVDIQHREMPTDDANDEWISYDNYPKPLVAGKIESFGDDALRDTEHHFHRIQVKAANPGETSDVKAVIYGV